MTEDRGVTAPDPVPDTLEVTVLRSGGVAGMVRRWTARIPDDGTPAARAARRIAALGKETEPAGNWRSKEHRDAPHNPVSGGTSDRQVQGGEKSGSPVRDALQWSVTCGNGSLRYDDADRRDDSEVDALIRRVTASG